MDNNLKKFNLQENQYSRPYHHLIDLNKNSTYDYLYWGLEYLGYLKFILNKINKIKKHDNTNICEIGCGDGKISIEVANKFNDATITGYDLAEQAISFAKSYSFNLKNCDFYCEDFNNFNGIFDIGLLIEVLEHIPDDEVNNFLLMISKKMNSNSRLIISVPTTNIPLNKKHYRHYDLDLLKSHTKSFFDIEEVNYIHNENSLGYKLIRSSLINRFFILNSNFFKSLLYKYYFKNLLISNKFNGAHLVCVLKLNFLNKFN